MAPFWLITCGKGTVMSDDLSTIDLKILEQIQKDCSLSTSELADKVGLS
jgi:Lrp/AsnC family transcriptional regulator